MLELLSLFSGVGGLDLGFEGNGFEVGLAFDIRKESIDSYNHNRDRKTGYVRDISELSLDKIDKIYGRKFRPTGVIGGPPCQGFSVSNVNKKKNDPRNNLSFIYANLLKELNSKRGIHFFVFENVKGLLGKAHEKTFTKIRAFFEEAGFNLYPAMLNALNYGVPQSRERLIMVGLNKKMYPDIEWSESLLKSKMDRSGLTVKNTIGNLPEPVFFSEVSNQNDIPFHANHWCMTPRSEKFFTKGALEPGGSFGRSFRTLEWNKPSPTVAYGNREVHVHPSCKRRLSVYEAMLLQGFPKDFELRGNLSQQICQVSEAVPPPLSSVIADSIVTLLDLDRA